MDLKEIPGVGDVAKKKLNEAGIDDVMQVLTSSPSELSELTGIKFDSIRTLVAKARKVLMDSNEIPKAFRTASEIKENNRDNVGVISTGTKCFDAIFDGGLETQAVTEVFGKDGSGKTQFCHTMAVRVQLPKERGGLGGKCLWIDTEKTFHPNRIKDISEGMELENVLDNIIVAHAHTSVEQQLLLEEAERVIQKENIKLLIVDSAIGLFRNEYLGMGFLGRRQQKITKLIALMSKIALNNNICVLITNQVMVDPNLMFGDPTIPVGGSALGHTVTYRVYLQKRGKKHYVKMIKSSHHPDMEQMFELSAKGIIDPVEEKKKTKK